MTETENLAILLTDMVGFTERSSNQSRADFHELLKNHDHILKETTLLYSGEWVKSTGDGMLVVFRSPTNAVQCGMAMQDALAEYNFRKPDTEQIHIRVAVNLGEVRREGDSDIFGEAVNVTARIEGLTPTDQVYFSQAVYLAMNKAEVPSEPVGRETLKGIPEPVEIYRVPAGQAVRLVASGEPMQGEGVPYPFGGMPHARVDSASATARPTVKGTWLKRGGIALLALVLLVAIANREPKPGRKTPALPHSSQTSDVRPTGAGKQEFHALTVVPEPATARVRILNIKPAYEPGMALQSGRYHIEVSQKGFTTERKWVDLSQDAEVAIRLNAKSVASTNPWPAVNTNPEILRRNDLFLVLSRTVAGKDFYLRRHPQSDWADGIRVAEQKDRSALARLKSRAEQGEVEAQLTMGWLYLQGKGVQQSAREGVRWMERAYQSGDPLALWFRGMALLSRQEKQTLFKGKAKREQTRGLDWIRKAADQGEPLGTMMLGIFYANGEHVTRDDNTAVKWLQKAVASGMPFAESMLAGMHLEGRGVEKNLNRAVSLLRSSAAKKDPTGQYYLGMLYAAGHGVVKDAGQARRLYQASSDAGFAEATKALANL